MGVAGKHLVAHPEAIKGHDQRNADLVAVRSTIARIAALRLRVGFRLALEIGARDVVEQYLVLDCKQLSAALRQMRFECGLVYEEMVAAAVEAILVDLFIPKLQQIGKRRAPIPILGNVQFARRLAESCKHKHRRHLCPSDMLLSNRQNSLTYLLKARPTPQRQRQIHVAKLPRALNANAFQTHRDGQMFAAIVEQRSLLGSTDQSVRKPP